MARRWTVVSAALLAAMACATAARAAPVGGLTAINLAKPFRNRKLRVGTVIQVRITKPGYIGRLLRYTIRKNKRPKSSPTCLTPDTSKQMTCPV
jgi:hypothetical protein